MTAKIMEAVRGEGKRDLGWRIWNGGFRTVYNTLSITTATSYGVWSVRGATAVASSQSFPRALYLDEKRNT